MIMSSRQREEESRMMLFLGWATTKRMVSLITKIGKKEEMAVWMRKTKMSTLMSIMLYMPHCV